MYQLQKSSSFSVLNPKNLIRQNQTPVGLSNIGNTCFINALLQVYFMIPYFRKSILQKTPHEIEWKTQTKYFEKEYPYYPFILELQRLFSYLILSSKKYYNPLLALTRFFEIQQKQLLTFGNQEDITEFNSIFCEFVNEGLKSCDPKKNSKTKTAIEKLFEGKERHYIEGTEEQSKTKFSHVQTNKFLQIILSVESGDLYSSLNQYTSKTEIEFTNRNKPTINTTKQIKFARLPPMMIFQLQRAQFDPKSKSMFKNSSPFVFEEIIYMDRFMEENSDAQIDAQESEQKIKKLEQEITHMRDFNDLNLPLADLLGNTARYFRDEFKPKKDFPDFPLTQLTELLINEEYRVRSKFDKKEKKLADLKSLRRKSFEDMKKIPYKLFAVLLHSGLTSNSGHYYSFVNEPTTQKWWKFNDHFVSEVTLSEVFNTSIGDSVSSAYVLFYRKVEFDSVSNLELNSSQIRKRFFNLSNCEQYIPNELKQEIDFDNKVFSQQLSEYEILQNPEMAKEIQSMKKSIDKKFLQKQQIIQHDKDPEKDLEKDPGLLDFSLFVLNNFKDFVACKYLIALESFPLQKDLFNLIIEANIDSNTMDKQLQIYNQACLQHLNYANWLIIGIKLMKLGEMVKALIQLLTSYHLMKNTTDSLIPIYRRIISFSLQTFFNNFKEANFLKTPNQDFIFMTKLISFTLFEDPFFFDVLEKIRSIWANIVSLNLENRSSLNFIDLILEINQNFTEKVKNLEISKPGASSYTNKKQLYDQFGVWMRWFTHNSKKIK